MLMQYVLFVASLIMCLNVYTTLYTTLCTELYVLFVENRSAFFIKFFRRELKLSAYKIHTATTLCPSVSLN